MGVKGCCRAVLAPLFDRESPSGASPALRGGLFSCISRAMLELMLSARIIVVPFFEEI